MSGLQLSKGRVVTVFLSQGTVDGGPPGKQPALSVTEAAQNSAEVTVSSRAKLALPPASSRAKLARTSRRPPGRGSTGNVPWGRTFVGHSERGTSYPSPRADQRERGP